MRPVQVSAGGSFLLLKEGPHVLRTDSGFPKIQYFCVATVVIDWGHWRFPPFLMKSWWSLPLNSCLETGKHFRKLRKMHLNDAVL